jgi:hypothetical protein
MDTQTLIEQAEALYSVEGLSGEQRTAELCLRAIQLGETYRAQCRAAQGQLVAQVAREKLYEKHPRQYPTLREYLKDAGLGESTVSDLVMLGELVTFCDRYRLNIDKHLGEKQWSKLREAIPALRQTVEAGDVPQARGILKDVSRLSTRGAVRAKYRRQRIKLGEGMNITLPSGEIVTVILPCNESAADMIRQRLGHAVEMNGYANGLRAKVASYLAEAVLVVTNGK